MKYLQAPKICQPFDYLEIQMREKIIIQISFKDYPAHMDDNEFTNLKFNYVKLDSCIEK